MLKGNLATRPFYNERLVTLALVVVGALAAGVTVYNAARLVRLSSDRHELRARTQADRDEAAKTRTQATAAQQSVDRSTLNLLAYETREANDLIDQRTFSWTSFFGTLETTMPMDVRLVSVSPRVERGVFKVQMVIVARSLDDVDVFTDALQATGTFYDVAPTDKTRKDDGTYSALIESSYLPPVGGVPKPQAAPARKGRP